MKPLCVFYVFSFLISSCGSLKEDEISFEIESLKIPLLEEIKKNEIYTVNELHNLFISNPNDLVYEIIFPSLSILEVQRPLPEDPVLRIMELKKRFYTYNDVSESDFTDNEISSIYADERFYYLGTIRGGIFRYPLLGDSFLELTSPYESIVNLSITDMDRTDENLIITSFSGLYTFNFSDKTLKRESLGAKYKNLTSLCVIDQSVFLGTVDGRLLQWKNGEITELMKIKNSVITGIYFTGERLLLGTSHSGVYEYIRETGLNNPINSVNSKLNNGKITFISYFDDKYWIGAAGDGLLVFDSDLNSLLTSEQNLWFLSSCQSDHVIYFGTHSDGVLFYDSMSKKRSAWGIEDGLSSLYIPSLFQANGSVFISTPDKGIVIISEEIHE